MPEDRSFAKPVETSDVPMSEIESGWDEAFAGLDEAAPAPEATPAPADQSSSTPAAPATPATPSTPETVSPEAVAPAVTPPATPDPAAPASVPEPVPHTFKADGRELPIPGIVREANGDIRIPAGSLQHLQRHLADRTEVQRRETQYRHQLTTSQQTIAAKDAARDSLLQQYETLIALALEQPEQVQAWAAKKAQEFPAFRANMERQEVEAQRRQIEAERQQMERERMRPQLEPIWRQNVAQYAAQMAQERPELAGLTVDDALVERIWAWKDQGLMTVADRDYPEAGVKAGEMAFSQAMLIQLLAQESVTHRRLAEARAQWETERATKAAQAQAIAQNTAAQQVKAPTAVPAAGARTPAAPPTDRPRRPDGTFAPAGSNKKTWDQELDDWSPFAEP